MGRQRNVTQQVEDRRTRMLDLARDFHTHPDRYPWLTTLLAALPARPQDGVLVELRSVPDQDCWVHYGIWLTNAGRFIKFSADERFGKRALDSSGQLDGWQIEDVTDATPTTESVPGIGRSFGALALEVLRSVVAGGGGGRRAQTPDRQ